MDGSQQVLLLQCPRQMSIGSLWKTSVVAFVVVVVVAAVDGVGNHH